MAPSSPPPGPAAGAGPGEPPESPESNEPAYNWRRLYALVLGALVASIVLLTVLSRVYR